MSTTMDQIHRIREMYYQQDKNISTIASETGLNWKTVKKYVDMEDFNMPDFMDLMAEGIVKGSREVLAAVRELAGLMSEGLRIPGVDFGSVGNVPALATAGGSTTNNKTTNLGGVKIYVNGYNVQDDDALAVKVANKINEMLDEDGSVFK